MTTRRYDNSTDLSRSKTRDDKPRHRVRRRPFGAHFEALQPESAEHPVDRVVDDLPLVVALTRKALRRAELIKSEIRDRKAFIDYEDLRLHLRTERELAYYNIGHEHGQVFGRFESLAAHDTRSRTFAGAVRRAATTSKLSGQRIATVLLELARAYLLGSHAPARRRLPGARR